MRPFAISCVALCLSGCGAAPPPAPVGGPRGPRANDHVQSARLHDADAQQTWRWPDSHRDPSAPGPGPWSRPWHGGEEHERLVSIHLSQAAALETAYENACADHLAEEVTHSPLRQFGTGGWNTENGVVLLLAPAAGPPERLLANIECHRAWMMLAPARMHDCPLDLPGIHFDAREESAGIMLSIGTDDRSLVPELQRRAVIELEGAQPW